MDRMIHLRVSHPNQIVAALDYVCGSIPAMISIDQEFALNVCGV